MFNDLIKYQSEINKLFEQHKIETAFIFGSSLTENFNKNSDKE